MNDSIDRSVSWLNGWKKLFRKSVFFFVFLIFDFLFNPTCLSACYPPSLVPLLPNANVLWVFIPFNLVHVLWGGKDLLCVNVCVRECGLNTRNWLAEHRNKKIFSSFESKFSFPNNIYGCSHVRNSSLSPSWYLLHFRNLFVRLFAFVLFLW